MVIWHTHKKHGFGSIWRNQVFEERMFGIRLHQKPENKILYLPAKSGHESRTTSNYVSAELKRYIRSSSKETTF